MEFNDNQIEIILDLMMRFAMSEMEEICPFETISQEQRDYLMKTAAKSLEVSLMLLPKILKEFNIDQDKLAQIQILLKEDKMQEMFDLLNLSNNA